MSSRKPIWSFLIAVLSLTSATVWARECSQANLKGDYAVFEQGSVTFITPNSGFPVGPTPYLYVQTANVTLDGAGNMSGKWSGSFGGVIKTGTFTGTYEVTPECAYSDEVVVVPDDGAPKPPLHHTGFVTGDGEKLELHYIYSDVGTVISGTGKKM